MNRLSSVLPILACAAALSAFQARAGAQDFDLIEPLQPFAYLLEMEEWETEIEFFGPGGDVRARGRGAGSARSILGGHAIERRDRLIEPVEIELAAWIFPDGEGGFRYVSYDTTGNFFDLSGEFRDGRFVFETPPMQTAANEEIVYRHVETPLGPDSFRFEVFSSSDGGETWRRFNTQINTAVRP